MSDESKNFRGPGESKPDYATRPDAYRHPHETHAVTLSPEDAVAVDSLLEHGAPDPAAPINERTKVASAWLETLGAHRASQPPIDLLQRTLEAAQADAMKIEPAPTQSTGGALFSRRVLEYAAMAIAASVLLVVLIPGISQARATARRVACADNLRVVGKSFENYATANGNALPSLDSPIAASWQPLSPSEATPIRHSNTANVLPLIRGNFLTQPVRLACPAAPAAPVPANWTADAHDLPDSLRGYSYINMYGQQKPTWDTKSATIILADSNPIFAKPNCASIHENSPNHAGKGSMVLYSDASARWQQSPDIGPNGDNIWTTAEKATDTPATYTFTEAPLALHDIFLSP